MLSLEAHAAYFAGLRRDEFARLDQHGCAYLDYTGSALYGASQVARHSRRLAEGVFGNPHSLHAPSRASAELIDAARRATLAHFDVSEDTHAVCFAANASAAIKLVAESYAFGPKRGLLLTADNHNSVNGMREYARRGGAPVQLLPLDASMRLDDPISRVAALPAAAGLLAFPAQSNFSGVRHPLALVHAAQMRGWDVLLDAAAYAPSHRLSLSDCPAQFSVFSFYKMFGLPTGLGALIARREALEQLRRPWFAGGTVEFASVQNDRHRLRGGAEGFEDGTPDFLSMAAVIDGLDFLDRIGAARLASRLEYLTTQFVDGLKSLAHANAAPLLRLYGPPDLDQRGACVAFNVLRRDGSVVAYERVERHAQAAGVAVRGGCFCNPGAAEMALAFDPAASARCFDVPGEAFSMARFSACMERRNGVGALRASFGPATSSGDIQRALGAIAHLAR